MPLPVLQPFCLLNLHDIPDAKIINTNNISINILIILVFKILYSLPAILFRESQVILFKQVKSTEYMASEMNAEGYLFTGRYAAPMISRGCQSFFMTSSRFPSFTAVYFNPKTTRASSPGFMVNGSMISRASTTASV